MGKKRSYAMSFKIDAVELVEKQGYSVPEAAKSLGVPSSNMYKWQAQYLEGRLQVGKTRAQPTESEKKLRDLEAKVKQLKIENEILKKAAAYFARDLT